VSGDSGYSRDTRTARKRAMGLGSAHHGAGVWIKERVSSIALVPLTLWLVWAAGQVAGAGHEAALQFAARPLNAILLLMLLLGSIYHMHLGVRVVVEDYIHRPASKATLLMLNLFVCLVLAAASLILLLKVATAAALGV
jgi:succinate dehydrogenase / fumarate reductase membrane anchor subunit